MNKIFPLHVLDKGVNNNRVVSYLPTTTKPFDLMDMYQTEMVQFVIGDKDSIEVAFSDALHSGYGGMDDRLIDTYIQNTLTDAYKHKIAEWMADNFRIDVVRVNRDRNNLGIVHVKTKIASKHAKLHNGLMTAIRDLNDERRSLESQISVLSTTLNNEMRKPIIRIAYERIKRFFRG